MRTIISATALALALLPSAPALARESAMLRRIDAGTVELTRDGKAPVGVWLSDDTAYDAGDRLVAQSSKGGALRIDLPASKRAYVILRDDAGAETVVAERELPLQQGSNFRDIGGYATRDGRTVRWGKVFRSGAMPLFTEQDYALVGQLGLDSVIDLRTLEEREIGPDLVDDRTGALFLANDYSFRPLFAALRAEGGENMYKGMEKLLAPQYRAIIRRILAGEGAVVYHCSAGQDRTGIATALIYEALGVPRETILKDYHLSTELRRPQWEMPKLDPAKYPDNPIVQAYAGEQARRGHKAAPLYTASGASHLTQFLAYIDTQYGGTTAYLKQELGFTDADLEKLRGVMLQ